MYEKLRADIDINKKIFKPDTSTVNIYSSIIKQFVFFRIGAKVVTYQQL